MRLARLVVTALVAVPGIAAALVRPQSPEIQVNTFTTGSQTTPGVGVSNGRFVIVWAETNGANKRVVAQRHTNRGQALGEITVDAVGTLDSPRVSMDVPGAFVVVWTTPTYDVLLQRYDANGMTLGGPFQVNTYTTSDQRDPDVAGDGAGNFVVVWDSWDQDASDAGVFGQVFASNGMAEGGEFAINTYTTFAQRNPHVAANGMGNFVVVWESQFQDKDGSGIFAQRHAANGMALGNEIAVNTYTTGPQLLPDVAMDDAGNFVVVWSGAGPGDASVFARRFDANGMALAAEFPVKTTDRLTTSAAVAMEPGGNFVVAWASSPNLMTPPDVFARQFDANGTALTDEFPVNVYTTGNQRHPSVDADGAGNFVVTWHSDEQDGDSFGVFRKRYVMPKTIKAKKAQTKDPTGAEDKRKTQIQGKERDTDIGAAILGDPTQDGATLRIVIDGATSSDQTYELDAAGWSTAGSSGYRYRGPTDVDGDPVKQVLLKRTPGGTAQLKVKLTGNVGTQALDVLPPNGAEDGGAILTIHGGATYCVLMGGEAGGTTQEDDAQQWKMKDATGEGCPSPSGAFLDPPIPF